MSQVTINDLREYLLENNPSFEETGSVADVQQFYHSEALDTKFGEIECLDLSGLAKQ